MSLDATSDIKTADAKDGDATMGDASGSDRATDVPATDVPAADVPATDVPAADGGLTDAPLADGPPADQGGSEVGPSTHSVGGTITGLTGGGLVLTNNNSDNLAVAATDTTFTFGTRLATGHAFAVTVLIQPTSPAQTCTVANGSGTVGAGDQTNVAVTCTTNTFTVGGTISGLTGSGLVLQNNGGGNLSVSAGATSFTFAGLVASGAAFAVTVATQPGSPVQNCVVSAGTGVVASANITSVVVNCAVNTFTVGGTVSGLAGTVVLHNGSENQTLTTNGAFAFPTPVATGVSYAVTVTTQPSSPVQVCTVTSGSGTIGSANVTSVAVTCVTSTFTVGGTITGLVGTGLVLRNNASAASDLSVPAASTTFTFVPRVASGGPYAVTVQTQPAGQTCSVAMGTGTVAAANVNTVAVTCTTPSFTVGGTISGLTGTSTGLVLRNTVSGGAGPFNINVATGATTSFVFPAQLSGTTYAVSVVTQPSNPTQNCVVTLGTGTVTSANITNVAVACTTQSFSVGGTISGLTGTSTGLVLRNTVSGVVTPVDVNVTAGATTTFMFPAQLSGSTYTVSVLTQPSTPPQNCTVTLGTGTVTTANVGTVAVSCSTNTFSVGGTISGLTGTSTGLVLRNTVTGGGGPFDVTVPLGAMTTFTFPAQPSGTTYAVTVQAQPNSPTQNCVVTMGTGTVAAANISSVMVTCTTRSFTVGGTVSNLLGTGLKVRNNGDAATEITVTSGTPSFTFPAQLSGSAYAVTISAQPTTPTQSCSVTAGVASGTVGSANVALTVTCTTSSFTVGGTVTNLLGTGLKVRNNGDAATEITVTSGTPSFTFPAQLSGSAYSVSVSAQPTGQTCTPTAPPPISGTVGGANVTGIIVSCVANVTPICMSVRESGDISNPSTLTLTCPGSQVMTVDFANFGTPGGSCPSGPFMVNSDSDGGEGNCPETSPTTTRSIVETACNTKSTCTITVATMNFGGGPFNDPCGGTTKTLTVHANCQ